MSDVDVYLWTGHAEGTPTMAGSGYHFALFGAVEEQTRKCCHRFVEKSPFRE